jgi:signal transduction histidine kinase
MDLKELVLKRRREFDTTLALIGVIPALVFVYILSVKMSTFRVFVGETGYIMLATMAVFLVGIMVGKKMFWSMMQELIEKNRLAAISETVLALGHEINNPLMAMSGNLELIDMEAKEAGVPEKITNRLGTVKDNCERIRSATKRLATLSNPVSTEIFGGLKMVDLSKSN